MESQAINRPELQDTIGVIVCVCARFITTITTITYPTAPGSTVSSTAADHKTMSMSRGRGQVGFLGIRWDT